MSSDPSSDHSMAGGGRVMLGVMIVVALGIRLAWGLSRPDSDEGLKELPDQVEYLAIARNVLSGRGLCFDDPRFGQTVYAFRMPGYPLFVAACGGKVQIVRAVQAVLDAGTVLGVFLLARRVMPGGRRRAALFAAAMVAFNPFLIYVSALVLSETVFVAMLMWGMVLLLPVFGRSAAAGRLQRSNGAISICAGMLMLALLVYIRPSAGVLPVVLGAGAVFVNSRNRAAYEWTGKQRALARPVLLVCLTMAILVAVVLAPWALRNNWVLHRWIWTDTNAGITLYDGYNPAATGASDQRFVHKMPQLAHMNEAERSQSLQTQAIEFICENPARAAGLMLAKVARTWSPAPLSEQFASRRNQWIGLLYAVPLDLLVLLGLWRGGLTRPAKVFLLLPAIYLTAIHALTIGSLRYRLPAEPALAIIAASVLNQTGPKVASRDVQT